MWEAPPDSGQYIFSRLLICHVSGRQSKLMRANLLLRNNNPIGNRRPHYIVIPIQHQHFIPGISILLNQKSDFNLPGRMVFVFCCPRPGKHKATQLTGPCGYGIGYWFDLNYKLAPSIPNLLGNHGTWSFLSVRRLLLPGKRISTQSEMIDWVTWVGINCCTYGN